MIEQYVTISPDIDARLKSISSEHPDWHIVVTAEHKPYNGLQPPIGWENDYVCHIMIHSSTGNWRAWLAPSINNISDYIVEDYINTIHLRKRVRYSKPLTELLDSKEGILEIVRSDKNDQICKISSSIDTFNSLEKVVDILNELPHGDVIDFVLWMIKNVDENIRDIDMLLYKFANTQNQKKLILTSMFATIELMSKLPHTIFNHRKTADIPTAQTEHRHPKIDGNYGDIIHRLYPNQKLLVNALRNELFHYSLWYPDTFIKPCDDMAINTFWHKIKLYWADWKSRFRQPELCSSKQ